MEQLICYILIGLGVLVVLSLILLLRTKKLILSWGISLLLCALILAGAGCAGLRYQQAQREANYNYIYMSLSYMKADETDAAALYLKRVNLKNDYCLLSAQTLLEQMRSNPTMAQLRLDMLKELDHLTVDQEDAMELLQKNTPDEDHRRKVIRTLQDLVPLSEAQKDALEQKFDMERGDLDEDELEKMELEERLRLEINQAIGQVNSKGALEKAIELVHLSPSQSNRLLLASVIAEVTYNDGKIKTSYFSSVEGVSGTDTQAEEADFYGEQYEDLCEDLEDVQEDIEHAEGEKLTTLIQKQQSLSDQAELARMQAEHVFAFRAMNSIADIYTLEAQVVRAKLYYAMRTYQEAFSVLDAAADSTQAKLSSNAALVNALELVQDTYQGENLIGVDSPEFRQEMRLLMGGVHPDMISFSLSPLATDFSEYMIDDQKNYGTGLYVIDLDDSAYPTIQVQLGGQKNVINRVASKETVVLSDTRNVLTTYEVLEEQSAHGLNSICFVVDTSGSMNGQPIADVQDALLQFLGNVDSYTEMSLVLFESSAGTAVPLTMNSGQMEDGILAINSGGGTDITSGIQEGTAALNNAKGTPTMIVMTDGQSSIDMSVVQAAVDQGITIFTIGFGDVNDELLQIIADLSGGQYLRAESSDELTSIYNSLRRVIGNTVTVRYTVSETDETNRYFYLRDEFSGLTTREPYQIGESSENGDSIDGVTITSLPVFQTRETLDTLLESEIPTFTISVNGTSLSQVTSAAIGTNACILENQSDYYLRLQVPSTLSDGSYDLILHTQDGQTLIFPQYLWIGQDVNYRYFRAGDLEFYSYDALLLPDGRLVLGTSISFSNPPKTEEQVNTLAVSLDGVLTFQLTDPTPLLAEGTYADVIHLSDQGTASASGILQIEYGDAAYAHRIHPTLLSGDMILEYSNEGSCIKAKEVSGS